jgi:hypothetical protein
MDKVGFLIRIRLNSPHDSLPKRNPTMIFARYLSLVGKDFNYLMGYANGIEARIYL